MQKYYLTKYTLIVLSAISLSLSGMRLGDGQLVKQNNTDHIITFKPIGGYFNLTPETKPQFEQTLKPFGITLDNINKVIYVIPIKQMKDQKEISVNSNEYIADVPAFLPLDLFTQGQSCTATSNDLKIKLVSYAGKQESSFKSHDDLLKLTLKQNSNKQSPLLIAVQEAITLQQQWDANPIVIVESSTKQKKTIIHNNTMEQQEQTGETINISIELVNLCQTVENMYADFGDKKASLTFPLEKGKEIETRKLFELLDQCLLMNTDGLEEKEVNEAKRGFNQEIEHFNLELLTRVLALSHCYGVVTTYEEKNIILQSSLIKTFLNKIEQTPYQTRSQFINLLDIDLQKELLLTFVTDKKLANLLQTQYKNLTNNLNVKNSLTDDVVNIALSYNPTTQQFNNEELTLEKAFLINDILSDKILSKDCTAKQITVVVKSILSTCDQLKTKIAENKAAQERLRETQRQIAGEQAARERIESEQQAARERADDEAARIKFNSYPERFKRLIASITPTSGTLKRAGLAVGIIAYAAYMGAYIGYALKRHFAR